jgi:hypothetical protein
VEQVGETLVDVIDVEGGNFHGRCELVAKL